MNEETRKKLSKTMKKTAKKALRDRALRMLFAFLFPVLLLRIAIDADWLLCVMIGCLLVLMVLVSGLSKMVFAVTTLSHANYLKKHPMECFQIRSQRFYRSAFSFFEMGHYHIKDKAEFELDGKKYSAYMYNALVSDGNGMLLVFRDTQKKNVVFAFPMVYAGAA